MTTLCKQCKRRPAGYLRDGRWKADKDHDLCFECYRKAMDKMRPLGRKK
jgi:hypothetical protein